MALNDSVKLGRVFEKRSKNGKTYFVGRLGAARLLILRDDRADENDPVWTLFVQDVPTSDQPRQPQPAQKPEAASNGSYAAVAKGEGDQRLDLNDPLPF